MNWFSLFLMLMLRLWPFRSTGAIALSKRNSLRTLTAPISIWIPGWGWITISLPINAWQTQRQTTFNGHVRPNREWSGKSARESDAQSFDVAPKSTIDSESLAPTDSNPSQ